MQAIETALPKLSSNKHVFEADHLGLMRESMDALGDVPELRRRMQADGYLYLPGLLNVDWVMDARRSITDKLAAEGFLAPGRPSIESVANPEKKVSFRPDMTVRNPAIIKLLYSGALMDFFTAFLGGEVLHFDFTWLRTMSPGHASGPHCDIVYMGRGTHNLFTAWTPLGDVPFEHGGLAILEGSNNHERLRNTYGKKDVDSFCVNRTGRLAQPHWAFGYGGGLSRNPNQIRKSIGGRWVTAEYRAGDVLLFTMFTIHASVDNQSKHVRISTDSRYQLASEPVDDRWVGDKPIGHGQAGKRGRIC